MKRKIEVTENDAQIKIEFVAFLLNFLLNLVNVMSSGGKISGGASRGSDRGHHFSLGS